MKICYILLFLMFLVLSGIFGNKSFSEDLSPDFSSLKNTEYVRIKSVIDSITFLTENGEIISLPGIDIPSMHNLRYSDYNSKEKSLDFIKEKTIGKKFKFYQTRNSEKGRFNRLSHHLGHLYNEEENLWVQGILLKNGFARVRTSPNNPEMYKQMYEIESKARSEKIGIWNPENEFYSPVLTASELDKKEYIKQGYEIVEGNVKNIATYNNNIFVNFGNNWRNDFTISVKTSLRKDLNKASINLFELNNQKIRIRGWLTYWNGAHIELTHPEQLEILSDDSSL